MSKLINLAQSAINNELVQTVNARELHEFFREQARLFNLD